MMRILNKVSWKDVIRESDKLLFLFSMSTDDKFEIEAERLDY
ncbi:hypothetical protein NXW89_00175 [Bacteroides thetaiotaomicron]|nr:hypothetical protein [Bacteroides thetaiotaomicron]